MGSVLRSLIFLTIFSNRSTIVLILSEWLEGNRSKDTLANGYKD